MCVAEVKNMRMQRCGKNFYQDDNEYMQRPISFVSEYCDESLGVEDPAVVPDSAFSASSSYDEVSVGPENAR